MQKAGALEITWNNSISVFTYCQMGKQCKRNKYFLLKHQLLQNNSTIFSWYFSTWHNRRSVEFSFFSSSWHICICSETMHGWIQGRGQTVPDPSCLRHYISKWRQNLKRFSGSLPWSTKIMKMWSFIWNGPSFSECYRSVHAMYKFMVVKWKHNRYPQRNPPNDRCLVHFLV